MSLPEPGDVFELTESQYKFGLGPIVCRVLVLHNPVEFDGDLWWWVRGDCKSGTLRTLNAIVQEWQRRDLYIDDRARPRRQTR